MEQIYLVIFFQQFSTRLFSIIETFGDRNPPQKSYDAPYPATMKIPLHCDPPDHHQNLISCLPVTHIEPLQINNHPPFELSCQQTENAKPKQKHEILGGSNTRDNDDLCYSA